MPPELNNRNNSGKVTQVNYPQKIINHWPLSRRSTIILAIAIALIVAAAIVSGAIILHKVPELPPERVLLTGPRGGQFYYNKNGNKVYVTPPPETAEQPK